VPRQWLAGGAQIELELPRNVTCAACEGGGCDACGRSGALTLRGRQDPAELVQITLPRRDAASSEAVVLRIPERGGLPEADSRLPRGLLLLRVAPGEAADQAVRRIDDGVAPDERLHGAPARALPKPRLWLFALVLLVALGLLLTWLFMPL
jgi:hypothetical protein